MLIVIFCGGPALYGYSYWLNLFLFSITLGYKVLLVGSSKMQFKDLSLALVSGLVLAGFLVLAIKLTKIIKGVDGFGFRRYLPSAFLGIAFGLAENCSRDIFCFCLGVDSGNIVDCVGKKKMGDYLPFGPFLILGTTIGLLYGEQLWNLYKGFLFDN